MPVPRAKPAKKKRKPGKYTVAPPGETPEEKIIRDKKREAHLAARDRSNKKRKALAAKRKRDEAAAAAAAPAAAPKPKPKPRFRLAPKVSRDAASTHISRHVREVTRERMRASPRVNPDGSAITKAKIVALRTPIVDTLVSEAVDRRRIAPVRIRPPDVELLRKRIDKEFMAVGGKVGKPAAIKKAD